MTAAAPATTAWRRRAGVSVTEVDDDAFLVDPGTESIFHLNALGRALWTLLATPQTLAAMTEVLHQAFPEVPAATVAADARGFVARLSDRRLIEPAN